MWNVIALITMILSLLSIPFGAPGLWFMIAVLAAAALASTVSPVTLGALIALAAGAEWIEFLLVKRYSERYGGSRPAFWGALAGGLIGVVIGVPVPLLGPILAGVLGTFLGAAAVTLWETRRLHAATRVGWGVVLARLLAIGAKMAAGIVVLVVGGGALFLD